MELLEVDKRKDGDFDWGNLGRESKEGSLFVLLSVFVGSCSEAMLKDGVDDSSESK